MSGFWGRLAYFTLALFLATVVSEALGLSFLGTLAVVTVVVVAQDLTVRAARRRRTRRSVNLP